MGRGNLTPLEVTPRQDRAATDAGSHSHREVSIPKLVWIYSVDTRSGNRNCC